MFPLEVIKIRDTPASGMPFVCTKIHEPHIQQYDGSRETVVHGSFEIPNAAVAAFQQTGHPHIVIVRRCSTTDEAEYVVAIHPIHSPLLLILLDIDRRQVGSRRIVKEFLTNTDYR